MTKFKYALFGLVLALLVGFAIALWVTTRKQQSLNLANLRAARDSISYYQIEIAGVKASAAEKDAIILTEKEAKEAGLLEIKRLKALHIKEVITNAELQGTIKILRDSLKLQPDINIISVTDTSGLSHDYVRIPFVLLNENTKYLTLNAGMHENRTAYYSLEVPLSGTMTIGYKKTGFLKTKPVGIFTSENPYLQINNMNILIVQDKKKWYNLWYVHALVGAVVWEGIHYGLIKQF